MDVTFLIYSNRIAVATIISFVAAALGSTNHLCYAAIASGSVVLILPVSYILLSLIFQPLKPYGRDILSFVAPSKSLLVTSPLEPSDWVIPLSTPYSLVSAFLSARRFTTKPPAKMLWAKVITCALGPML